MSWRYREPDIDNYDDPDDYERAMSAYEDALDLYVEEYIERTRN